MTTIAQRKTLSKWHEREERACRDYYKSPLRIAAEERDELEARGRRRRLRYWLAFLAVTVIVVAWVWLP